MKTLLIALAAVAGCGTLHGPGDHHGPAYTTAGRRQLSRLRTFNLECAPMNANSTLNR
jgi:hypothetical protein